MLNDGRRMFAYAFEGYWKDVGTIGSLWEANMDLLGSDPAFRLHDPEWRIYFRNNAEPPHLIGDFARVTNSLITEGCEIQGVVENCVLSSGVKVARGAYVKDSVIMSGVTIGEGATVNYSIIDSDTEIGAGSVIGRTKSTPENIALVGSGLSIAPGTDIPGGAMVNAKYLAEKAHK